MKRRMRGRSFLVRYADDAVLVFERKDDAERVMEVIGRHFAKCGLELHPDKTRLVRFVAPEAGQTLAYLASSTNLAWQRYPLSVISTGAA